MPRLGALLESQCTTLQRVEWQLHDPQGATLATGSADRENNWRVEITPGNPPQAVTPELGNDPSALADRTPWQEFTLQDGCRLRTFWTASAGANALFIPAGKCEKGGWLSGQRDVIERGSAGENGCK